MRELTSKELELIAGGGQTMPAIYGYDWYVRSNSEPDPRDGYNNTVSSEVDPSTGNLHISISDYNYVQEFDGVSSNVAGAASLDLTTIWGTFHDNINLDQINVNGSQTDHLSNHVTVTYSIDHSNADGKDALQILIQNDHVG